MLLYEDMVGETKENTRPVWKRGEVVQYVTSTNGRTENSGTIVVWRFNEGFSANTYQLQYVLFGPSYCPLKTSEVVDLYYNWLYQLYENIEEDVNRRRVEC